jgi:hypothetical protein
VAEGAEDDVQDRFKPLRREAKANRDIANTEAGIKVDVQGSRGSCCFGSRYQATICEGSRTTSPSSCCAQLEVCELTVEI